MIIERLLDHSPATMLATDLFGRIFHANRQWLDTFARGQSLDQVIGKQELDFFPAVVRKYSSKRQNEVRRSGRPRDYDLTMTVRGSTCVFLVHKFPIFRDDSDEIVAVGTVTTDITSRRREQARAAVERDRSERLEAVGEFAAGLAHDFNNLLGLIELNTDFARRDREDPDRFETDMSAIDNATKSGTDLVNSLLTFSRRKPGEKERLIIRDIAHNLTEMFGRLLDSKIKIRTIHDQGPPWYVVADRTYFERTLLNLVVNARDAMPDGGRLTINIAKIVVDDIRYVKVIVADTGEGMSEEVKKKIFEPFFTTKPRGKGSGLGLATVYGIVRDMGGHIEVESKVGQGTTFTLWLPAFDPVELEVFVSAS